MKKVLEKYKYVNKTFNKENYISQTSLLAIRRKWVWILGQESFRCFISYVSLNGKLLTASGHVNWFQFLIVLDSV